MQSELVRTRKEAIVGIVPTNKPSVFSLAECLSKVDAADVDSAGYSGLDLEANIHKLEETKQTFHLPVGEIPT